MSFLGLGKTKFQSFLGGVVDTAKAGTKVAVERTKMAEEEAKTQEALARAKNAELQGTLTAEKIDAANRRRGLKRTLFGWIPNSK